MRVLLQRVSEAFVTVNDSVIGEIKRGILVLVGIEDLDDQTDIDWLCGKICKLRIFPDDKGVMNLSLIDVNGEALVISQFTLHASLKKGNRPSYIKAAQPDISVPLYKAFIRQLSIEMGKEIQAGEFGADMKVALINDGPVTLWIDSKKKE